MVGSNSALKKERTIGEIATGRITDNWKGDFVADAAHAAMEIGLLVSGNMLARHRAEKIIKDNFDYNRVDDVHWSTVNESFMCGINSVMTNAELRRRMGTVSANDNIALPLIDPRDWQGLPIPDRPWFVEGWIPSRTVTNLTGDGGSGKTELMLQLIACSSLGTPWFGIPVSPGPCLYYGAEDEADELHRRLAKIVEKSGRELKDLDGIRLIPMAERDAVLAEPDKSGKLLETTLFNRLRNEAISLRPKLIVIDPSADVFGGDEINRGQVRKFVSMLRTLAIELDCAVLLLSHPSISGIISGTGSSGSTGWRNSVRSRLYLVVPTTNGKPDPDVRILQVQKANYGRTGEEIKVRWDEGVYVLDKGLDPAVINIVHAATDKLFLELLALFSSQGQHLGVKSGTTYAPAKMVEHPKAKGYSKKQLADAMQRLLDKKVIRVKTEGSPSRMRSWLEPTTS